MLTRIDILRPPSGTRAEQKRAVYTYCYRIIRQYPKLDFDDLENMALGYAIKYTCLAEIEVYVILNRANISYCRYGVFLAENGKFNDKR